ncbi:MAG: DUF4350 domain-containing protein [Microthrixaceae bacterium]
MKNSAALWVGTAILAVFGVALFVLTPDEALPPFDVGSSKPDGYRAVAILLEDAGVDVRSVEVSQDAPLADLVPGPSGAGIVVPVEEYLEPTDRAALQVAAETGATVVVSAVDGFIQLPESELARTAARPVARGFCDIAELEELQSVDDIAGANLAPSLDSQVCFESGFGPLVSSLDTGDGRFFELASPYLWANARLQPDKEDGGRALDNAATAVALLGDLESVTFVTPIPPPEFVADGTRNPLELMPLPVKLAILQAVGAFVIYVMWRARRLGRPVAEEMPVEIAGSELVEAVGGLLRRSGSPTNAAAVLRAETRRELSRPLGVPIGADPAALVEAVVARTGGDPQRLRMLLFDGPVETVADLVALSRGLDEIELEVLDVQHA